MEFFFGSRAVRIFWLIDEYKFLTPLQKVKYQSFEER